MSKKVVFVVIILMIVMGIIICFLYPSLFLKREKVEYISPEIDLDNLIINETSLTYLLYKWGFSELHNPPLSFSTPKINLIISDEEFNSEVKKGEIKTERGLVEEEDVTFISSKQELIDALKSDDAVAYIIQSINNGKTQLIQVKNKMVLFSKGYFSLYKKFTGEELEAPET